MHVRSRRARPSSGRFSRRLTGLAGLLALSLAAFTFAGCSKVLDNTQVTNFVKNNSQKNGQAAKSADCPSDQTAKVGSSFDCTVTFPDGSKDTAHVDVTGVSGNTYSLSVHLGGAGSSGASSTGGSGSSSTTGSSGSSSSGSSGSSSTGSSGSSSTGGSSGSSGSSS